MQSTDKKKQLRAVHSGLLQEMENIQKNLPGDVEDISEAFERYARIVSLLVRSLDTMLKLENQKQESQTDSGPQTRRDLISDIEQKLARLADQPETAPTVKGA